MPAGSSVFFRIQLRRTLRIALGWFFAGVGQAGYDYFLLRSKDLSFDLVLEMMSRGLVGFIGGFLSGVLILGVFRNYLRRSSYGWILVVTIGIYLGLMLLISVPAAWIYFSSSLDSSTEVVDRLWRYVTGFGYLKDLVFWGAVIIVTVIAITIQDKYGPGTLRDLLIGKYHHPRFENRIFMFIDMKDSTPIAERLGEEKFFELVADCVQDATNAILINKGLIYQYVGDEIVITWRIKDGLEADHFLHTYFDIVESINDRSQHYEQSYGLVPQFKAGVHEGICVVGEMGVIKKEISYYGDVLNTTARIQGKCNDLGAWLLVSDALLGLIDRRERWNIHSHGEIELKGKVNRVAVSEVHKI